MFRGCYFEFAGKSSEPYNLMLFYKDNKRDDFNSGGEFELKTDSIPYSEEQYLYGKDYSEKPLEFEVEIVTPEGNIPQMQMVEIKNWLFGQDGWRDLTVTDDTQAYHLKCVLIPSEDITDCNGYRGVRCTIHNASPFWYGDEREIVISHSELIANGYLYKGARWYYAFNIFIPDNDCVDFAVFPEVKISIDKSNSGLTNINEFYLATTDAENVNDALSVTDDVWDYSDTSAVVCDISYVGFGTSSAKDNVVVNTKYATLESQNHPEQDIPFVLLATDSAKPSPFFRLKYGDNICRIRYAPIYSSITIKYIPMYRMGAF